jgi:hypothetical protein
MCKSEVQTKLKVSYNIVNVFNIHMKIFIETVMRNSRGENNSWPSPSADHLPWIGHINIKVI